MKEVNPEKDYRHLFYKYNFEIISRHYKDEKELVEIQTWLDDNLEEPHGMIHLNFWHGEGGGSCGGSYYIITMQDEADAILFKTTWL